MAPTALASPRAGTPVTLRRMQSPCALCRGDRAGFPKKETPRGWRPRRSFGLVPSRGEVPRRGKTLGEASPGMESLARLGDPRQAWRAWSLAKISEDVVGPGRPARGTLVSTVPTTPPLYRKVAASIHLGRTQRVFRRGTGTQLTVHEFIVLQEINNQSSSHEIIGMKYGM